MTNFLRSRGLESCLMVAALGLFGTSNAKAAETFPYGGTLQPNVEYVFDLVELSADYTPSTSGQLTYNCGSFIGVYTDAEHTQRLEGKYEGYVNGSQAYTLNVTKDVTLYFYADEFDVSWNAQKGMIFEITQNAPVEIIGYSDDPGSVLSVTSGFDELLLYVNQPVHASKAILSVPSTDASIDIEMSEDYSTTLAVNYVSSMLKLMDEGAIKGDEEVTITVRGIMTSSGVLYDNGNDLVLKYKAPTVPIKLVSIELPNPFCSYWENGDGGILRATYSAPISEAKYELMYGNFEPGTTDNYTETGSNLDPDSHAKVTVDNNIVTIDFAGYKRTPEDMLESGKVYSEITIRLTVYDANGELGVGEDQGSLGTSTFVLPYKNDLTTNVEDALSTESTTLKVYTIEGRQITSAVTPEDVKVLSKGLYIINGQKVIVK